MDVHPVLDKVFLYAGPMQVTNIVELLQEHPMAELRSIWNREVPEDLKVAFKRAHGDNDLF